MAGKKNKGIFESQWNAFKGAWGHASDTGYSDGEWNKDSGDMSVKPSESAKSDPETAEEPPLFYSAPKSDRDVEMDFMQGREVTDPDKDMMLEDGDWQLDTEEDEDTKKAIDDFMRSPKSTLRRTLNSARKTASSIG